MSRLLVLSLLTLGTLALLLGRTRPASATSDQFEDDAPPRLVAWNDLGMHCLDPDFSVFSILPPFNTLNAHLIVEGQVKTAGQGFSLSYEAIADPSGSINSTSIGKTNFWDHEDDLFGVDLPLDVGLAGHAMPGLMNQPQSMSFVAGPDWFQAEGIPMTPIDDAGAKNPYPLMKVVARDMANNVVAETITTAPNSRELTCSQCHASGASPYARPAGGWAHNPDSQRDDRLNILRLHDERHLGEPAFTSSLQAAGYDALGLLHTATVQSKSVLCASCHASNALPGTGQPGISALTAAIHAAHADARGPAGLRLDDDVTRNSCFTCHPGFDTQCLRGAMGKAIGADGEYAMHCQSCHGGMSEVGDPARVGWLEQPNCQSCHSGTATNNSGAIRFTTVFDANGDQRIAANQTFGTEPNVPQVGFDLFRFSAGHGGLQCAACHGPPHAIYPTALANDNLQSLQIQGHVGTISECSSCHGELEDDQLMMGPHGMHPADEDWATDKHGDHANGNLASCMACHGANLRGTELSRSQGDRSYVTQFGTKNFWRGFEVGCYDCHQGAGSDNVNPNSAPLVSDQAVATSSDLDATIPLSGMDANGDALSYRIVSQPEFRTGTVALSGNTATFKPEAGFSGSTTFTYAAYDGDTWSNLGTVTVAVSGPVCDGNATEYGFGSPSSGDFLLHLSVTGCPEPGGLVTIHLDSALGGSTAFVVAGTSRAATELFPGWMIHVGGPLIASPLLGLNGAGPGQGSLSLTAALAAGAGPLDLYLQAFVADPAAPFSWATSNGVKLHVE